MVLTEGTKETVQGAATGARILTYVKENRLEMIGLLILAHLLGVSDRVLGQLNGVCF
jgi:hypothetical protein